MLISYFDDRSIQSAKQIDCQVALLKRVRTALVKCVLLYKYNLYNFYQQQMKKAAIITLLLIVIFASEAQVEPSKVTGDFFDLDLDFSSPLQNTKDHPLADIENFVRSQLATKPYLQGRTIGSVIRVELQVVEGLNYRLTFENQAAEKLQATVHEQPWANTRRLTRLVPFLGQEM